MNMTLRKVDDKMLLQFRYDPALIAKVKMIPGARWLKSMSAWCVPIDRENVKMAKDLFPWATVDPQIQEWEEKVRSKEANNVLLKQSENVMLAWHDGSFNGPPLFEHQKKALDLCFSNEKFALAMEMGTGKTRVMIELMRWHKKRGEKKPWLVACPLSVVSVWAEQIKQYAPELSTAKLVGDRYEREDLLREERDVFIVNYEGLRILSYQLEDRKWNGFICDESHRIKSRTSQQSKCAYRIAARCDRRYILTGTMITNNPLDAFGQFKFLDESILGSNFFAFQNRYAIMVTHGRARFPVKFVNLTDLASRIAPWTYRVTKEEAKLNLPPKIYETRYIDLPDNAKKIYKDLGRELLAEVGNKNVTAPIILTKILRFSQITAGFVVTEDGSEEELHERKVDELMEILAQSQEQCVVWTKFRREMEMVKRKLDEAKIPCATLSGDTSQAEREEILNRFRDRELRVFIGQIQAGGTGISLATASLCVYMSNPFSLGDRLQSEDRLHRIGQQNAVTYIDLICPGTIDESVIKILRNKKSMADIIQGDRPNLQLIEEMIGGHRE